MKHLWLAALLLTGCAAPEPLILPEVAPPTVWWCARPTLIEVGPFYTTGTVSFEASDDKGQNWAPIYVRRRPNGQLSTETTTEGSFYACVEWADFLRLRVMMPSGETIHHYKLGG